tara:strand:- start:172 stop:387 length:216 start_codon:yes stop_codon:yes gene_type:complete
MNLEVDVMRVRAIAANAMIKPMHSISDPEHTYAKQINHVVATLKEQQVDVPPPVYTKENISVIIRHLYYLT